MHKTFFMLITTMHLVVTASAQETTPAYSVHDVTIPSGVVIEAGGVTYWPDGSLVVATRRGEVWTERDGKWTRFASGLHEPLGLWADSVGEAYVTQSPEVTRLRDTDGDGQADRYETVTADWEVPGATADFVYGLCRDAKGNFFGTMHTSHGPWAKKSKLKAKGRGPSKYHFGGPMGAPVIGRGWSFKIDTDGKLSWHSSGLRAPNGLGFNGDGELFATDNQGDWVGTSAMHHIEEGDFHGHPSSYQWDPKRSITLTNMPLDQLATELKKLRKPPAVLFPHGIVGNSPSQPVMAPKDGRFGPFQGQFFVGDNIAPLLSRVYLEKIDGKYQGAVFPFFRGQGLRKALCRMSFTPTGSLMVAFGCRGWGPVGPSAEGLQEIKWNGNTPFDMQTINLHTDGFSITFTKPLASQDLAKAIQVQSYYYKYHHKYGSPTMDLTPAVITESTLSKDRKTLHLGIDKLTAGRIYEFGLEGVTAEDATELKNNKAYYTLNTLKPARSAAADWALFPLCMDTHDAQKRSLAEQARLLKELGFDGIGHICQDLGYGNITHPANTTLEERIRTLRAVGLRLHQAYGRIYLQKEIPINLDRIREILPKLAEQNSQLVLLLLGDRTADLDDKAVSILGKIADMAKPHGVDIAIYPHSGDYTQTLDEALRVVKKLNRVDDVGVMFTFSHWMNKDPDKNLRAVLKRAAPFLKAAFINGSNKDNARVLPLDQGDFDMQQVISLLQDLNFKGPMGVMCWNISGDARDHLSASMSQWKEWTTPVTLSLESGHSLFETETLKGQIAEGRFIGLKHVIHKPSGTKISGDGRANKHGLLTLYRVFTKNHRYGSAAYDWKDGRLSTKGNSTQIHWPSTDSRPFELEARYSFIKNDEVELEVRVTALKDLEYFEVQVASYFDQEFPVALVHTPGSSTSNSPKHLGSWHAFPKNERALDIIKDGRWSHGPSPVSFVFREPYGRAISSRQHSNGLRATLSGPNEDCFAIYTAHDGERHFSNYHALFGRTIKKGETATARLSLTIQMVKK